MDDLMKNSFKKDLLIKFFENDIIKTLFYEGYIHTPAFHNHLIKVMKDGECELLFKYLRGSEELRAHI